MTRSVQIDKISKNPTESNVFINKIDEKIKFPAKFDPQSPPVKRVPIKHPKKSKISTPNHRKHLNACNLRRSHIHWSVTEEWGRFSVAITSKKLSNFQFLHFNQANDDPWGLETESWRTLKLLICDPMEFPSKFLCSEWAFVCFVPCHCHSYKQFTLRNSFASLGCLASIYNLIFSRQGKNNGMRCVVYMGGTVAGVVWTLCL